MWLLLRQLVLPIIKFILVISANSFKIKNEKNDILKSLVYAYTFY